MISRQLSVEILLILKFEIFANLEIRARLECDIPTPGHSSPTPDASKPCTTSLAIVVEPTVAGVGTLAFGESRWPYGDGF